MLNLTDAQIFAAKNGDAEAIDAILSETEDRVTYHAYQYATSGGRTDLQLKEDLAQEGRIAVWESLSRFKGIKVSEFFAFMDRTVKGVMTDARKVETRQGVSRSAAAYFEQALSAAGGDPYEAEFLATTVEVMGDRRMTPEMAYAARLSHMGLDYLDAPLPQSDTGDYTTLGETLADKSSVPEDLLTSADVVSERSKATTKRVRETLSRLGNQQRIVLQALTGVGDVNEYGTDHDDELAADYDLPRHRIKVIRSKGKDRFADLYLKSFGQ